MKNKITSLIVIASLLFINAFADNLNSSTTNPSMAVTGTQRTSTAITDYVIPVAVSGATCNSTTDIVAVTSDHSSQLICQSGAWTPVGGSGGVTGSNAANGYAKFSNGLIIQWGKTPVAPYTAWTSLSFPIAFPNACFMVTNAMYSGNHTSSVQDITGQYNWGFTFGQTAGYAMSWIAIGY